MTKQLVIVFVKNIKLGKVKTRLAKTIGNEAAFHVYKELVAVTKNAIETVSSDKRIYFSEAVVETKWPNLFKATQSGDTLGDRMKNAFKKGFEDGYESIVLIGSDLPDISAKHITNGLDALKNTEVVFGPAEDGGYYLIGLSKMHDFIFDNKPWSQPSLLKETLAELQKHTIPFTKLAVLNDIDTYEDLVASNFYKTNEALQLKINQLND